MTAAEIAAKQALLAAIKAAHNSLVGVVNDANTRLNAAIATGKSPELVTVQSGATAAVLALNAYSPRVTAAIAAAAALVPDAPPDAPPAVPPVLVFPAGGIDIVVGATLDLSPFVTSSKPVGWSMEPNAFATLSAGGLLTGTQAGGGNAVITANDA